MPALQLYGSVGPEEENNADDVASVGTSLVDLGLAGAREAALSGAWDNRFDATVKSFQVDNGLDVDGVLLPGGPTQAAINQSLEVRHRAPTDPYARIPPKREANDAATVEPTEDERSHLLGSGPSLRENASAAARRAFDRRSHEKDWRQADPSLPPISDAAAKVLSAVARQREAQFDNFLKLLGSPTSPPASAAEPPALRQEGSDEEERILTARGYSYMPDPMGRLGWGDWVDAGGKLLDDRVKDAIIARETTTRPKAVAGGKGANYANLGSQRSGGSSENRWEPGASHILDHAQASVFARSELGVRFSETMNRIREAVGTDGVVPAAVWQNEFRKLGIEPGQIEAQRPGVTLVTNPGDEESTAAKDRTPQSFFGKAWSWLTDEIPGLAEEKARTIDGLNAEIRAIQSEPRWRSNFLNLIALQSLQEARTGIIGGFPTSRLDFALAGIDIIGMGMVGSRPLLILRKGEKVITSADLAEGGFRSRQALDLGKDVPYNSHSIRAWFEQRYGAEKVTSLTVPPADYHLVQLAGKRHPVTGIVFDAKGFPIFDDVAKFDTRLPSEVFGKGQ